jgi:cobalt-zinc-cadmium resistance protein CzcA
MKIKTITRVIIILLISISITRQVQAQTNTQPQPVVMTLDSAISVAIRNNPDLQSSQLEVVRQQKLKKTAFDFGKTGIFFENEDLIKSEKDNKGVLKIGVTQTIDFPTTYFAQNKINKQNVILSQTSLALTEKELVRDVRGDYFILWFAVEKRKLFLQQDSIFTEFENAATLRYSTGETNYLEKISAQARHKEIQLALQSANTDVTIAQQELMKLMNTAQSMLPVNAPMQKLQTQISLSQLSVSNHPYLNLYQQKISLSDYERKLEINKLLPDISVRFFNQNLYNVKPGYYGYSIGIGIPLFFWGQQGKIQGAKIQQQIAKKDFESATLRFNTSYNKVMQELVKQQSLLVYYENSGLQQANEILNTAMLAFKNGEIGYIEYTTLLSQSIDIKNSYLSVLTNYNLAVIQINYFINQ